MFKMEGFHNLEDDKFFIYLFGLGGQVILEYPMHCDCSIR